MSKPKRNRRGQFVSQKTKAKSPDGIIINRISVPAAEGSEAFRAANAAASERFAKALAKAGVPIFETKPMSLEDAQARLKKIASKRKTKKGEATDG